jgi:alanyl-tRNA synthetase
MARRLYYDDSYLRRFRARVTSADGLRLYLEETAFYPASGGQPFDTGQIGDARVVEVAEDEDGGIAHLVDAPLQPGEYDAAVDWTRRFDHMQQHSGQHLLSAVLTALHGIATVSVHIGAETSTIDIDRAAVSAAELDAAETRANEIVFENRAVRVSSQEGADGLRKAVSREGTLRVVSIDDLDRSACGGTHVRSTAEIGPVAIRRLQKMRGNVRIEFVCGGRAIAAWKSDCAGLRESLADSAAKLAVAEKQVQKLALDAARIRGRELYAATEPDAAGLRVAIQTLGGAIGEDTGAEAQAFTGFAGAVFIAQASDPAAVLIAVSAGLEPGAGAAIKPVLEAQGGRGGGNPRIAQGSLPSKESAEAAAAQLAARYRVIRRES